MADKSVQFLEKVVFKKGLLEFEGVRRLIVVNQFAYIQTNDFEGLPHQIGELNDAAITVALHESDIVILAWGSSNRFEERKAFVHGILGGMKHNKTLLKTKMHPSRGRYDGFIQPTSMRIAFNSFSQRGTGKAHNEDVVLLDCPVHQGSVREHGEIDTAQPRYFAVADGVSSGTLPRTASRVFVGTAANSPCNGSGHHIPVGTPPPSAARLYRPQCQRRTL